MVFHRRSFLGWCAAAIGSLIGMARTKRRERVCGLTVRLTEEVANTNFTDCTIMVDGGAFRDCDVINCRIVDCRSEGVVVSGVSSFVGCEITCRTIRAHEVRGYRKDGSWGRMTLAEAIEQQNWLMGRV
jgi:hypothetical protein